MDRAQKLVRCPPPTRVPRSLPTGPPEPPLAVLLAPLLWAAGHPATRGGSLRGATCSNQQPLDSSRIQGQPSPRVWRRERNGVEEEKEAGEQLSAHPRRRRPRGLDTSVVCRTHSASSGFPDGVSFPLGVPEAQRERGRPHTAGENQATWPGAPPLAPQRLRRLLRPRGALSRASWDGCVATTASHL